MKLSCYDNAFQGLSTTDMLDRAVGLGLDALEIGTGVYSSGGHCDASRLLADADLRAAWWQQFADRDLAISALSHHGNALSPDAELAQLSHGGWRTTVRLASELEIPVVNTFSGCPGSDPEARNPNWVTCSWPPEYSEILAWQWDERVIPYWQAEAEFAARYGVSVGIEMHPGFVVYNPETLLRLRDATGPAIKANFDPSHLWWQGIDPVEAIRMLGAADAIAHVHAKDTYLDAGNIRRNGVLDTKPYTDVAHRSWTFRTVGYGAGEKAWRDMVSMLRAVGYDHAVSIEHEDPLASLDEGLARAAGLLRSILFVEHPIDAWWA